MDLSPDDAESVHRFREAVADLEKRARSLAAGALRHDVGNAVGAARNALALVEDTAQNADRVRFVEIARRNADRANELLRRASPASESEAGDVTPGQRSGSDERDDLRGSREG